MKQYYLKRALLFLMLPTSICFSCKGTIDPPKEPIKPPVVIPPVATVKTIYNLDWNNRPNQSYSQASVIADFGNIADWNATRANIQDGTFRVTLLKNLLSGSGGLVAKTNIEEGSEYRLSYEVKFDTDFDFGVGGKIGFGLRIGEGNTGCDKANDGNGGSARLMWYTSNGVTKFKPYMYYNDMPENCGDNVVSNAFFPSTGSIQKNKWYKIVMLVKSNTGANKDGKIEVSIDGNMVLNQSIRWTTNDSKRLINKLSNDTFRGGNSPEWTTSSDGFIYLDNLKLEKLN